MTDNTERSVSRGRENFQSSGRGGLGNIRPSSASRDRVADGPDDFSPTRGREPEIHAGQVYSTGRGGAGNISREVHPSPSRRDQAEETLLRAHAEADKTAVHSSGRGGLGNISRSRSRGRSPLASPPVHSTGRGGAGNILPGEPHGEDLLEEELERKSHVHAEGVHSTGRGGAANITSTHEPAVEHHAHNTGEFESFGRGGAGNMLHGRAPSREPDVNRTPSKERHGLAGFIHKVTHPHSHPATPKEHSPAPKEGKAEGPVTAGPPPVVGEQGLDPVAHRGGIL